MAAMVYLAHRLLRGMPLFVLMWCIGMMAVVPATHAEERPFVIAIDRANIELHPHKSFTVTEAQLFTALYEGLVGYHPRTLAPEAAVAERWDISSDGLVYTFYLRDDARYWNGDAVVAEHFRDAWIALLSPEANSYFSVLFDVVAGVPAYRTGATDSTEGIGIEVVDARTLRITLAAPAPFFLSTLCHYSFSPIHPRMQQIDEWNESTILLTNGPYTLKSMDLKSLVLEQNEEYWDYTERNFTQIRYAFIDEERDIFDDFVERSVDWVISGFGEEIARYNRALQINPLLGTNFYFFAADRAPWDDLRVRRALAMLVPWERIRDTAHYVFPSAALVPPLPGYEQEKGISTQNTEEAMRLLDESGYTRGDGLPPLIIAIPDSEEDTRVGTILQESWEQEINLKVILRFIPSAEYFDYVESDTEYTLGRISWIGDYVDPLAFLQLWSRDSNLNHARYDDSKYDSLLLQAMKQEGKERFLSLSAAERLILDGALVLPINHAVAINAIDTEQIAGWYPNILDIHPVKHLSYQDLFLLPNVALRASLP